MSGPLPFLLSIDALSVALPAGADRPLALDGVSLALAPGEILCVVGESGSGKSMTAGAVLGLLPDGVRRSAGRILFEGRELTALSEADLRRIRGARIGMIFQEPMTALNPLRTIGDQIGEVFRTHTRLPKAEIARKVRSLLEDVQIPQPLAAAGAYPHELSGGQRQRAMIAMALALEPSLLIADEPTTALDVTTQAQILRLIRELQQRKGTAVLFITHDFGVVAEIADRIAVMRQGEVVETGPAAEILARPQHPYTQALLAAVPALEPPPRGQTGDTLLAIDGIGKTYRGGGWLGRGRRQVQALDQVSLALPRGGALGIVGESGSGKSTLARCLVGLLDPDRGSLRLDGADLLAGSAGQRRQRARRIQMVFQDPFGSLNPRRRVGELVAQGPLTHGEHPLRARHRAAELFELVGLDPSALDRYPHEFSGGQRQRIGLARALALSPDVLVADEPVSALDVSVQAQVLALLDDLRARTGLSLILITHDLRVAAQVCDRVAVMKDGRVVEEADTATLFGAPRHPYTQALLAAVPGRRAVGRASAAVS
ncbi:ABC transporter ATP-binding protein [Cupriavidus sp. UME77]|uniref:ABC transporter ATP-binding protein n=1 Tax=Cupriavidus sp. UME77 TaxID=1862321 RepID=UPI0016002817|nr:ABC transporter ATP-binding protein [Cupriavidus sp. UME77]MBB1633348.1 microcin ABC transporter ATP-binding protein [Cupriavidus sp. UME77]